MVLGGKISHVLLLNMKRSSVTPLLFFKWSILKEGGIASWKEGCCVVGCIGHLLSSANLLSSYKDSASVCGFLLSEEEIWVWKPPATRLVCRQDDVVLLGIESAV